jgi:hypothetical protein
MPASIPNNASVAPVIGNASSGSMYFPKDLQKQPYWISFSFYQYQMPNLTQQNIYYNDAGTIRLPLPNSMVDNQGVSYDEEKLGTILGVGINQLQKGNVVGGGAALGAAAAQAANVPYAGAAVGALTNTLNSPIASAVGQMNGVAVNPFLTVMFKSPQFKKHTLEWKLSPSNEQESATLNSIINTFKGNMLPDQNAALGGTLLTYPNIVQAQVSVNNGSYFTYVFKPAVVESFQVNWTPSNQPSFFGSTKAPTEVAISLNLLEIEFWLSSDYGVAGNQVTAASLGSAAGGVLQSGITQIQSWLPGG